MTKSSITGININWPHDSVHGYLQQVMKEFHYLYSVCQHPPQETGVLKYMSEVFICRGGSGSGGGGIWNGYAKVLEYKIFANSGLTGFNMPFNIVDNKVDILVYGAGGGGWMNWGNGSQYYNSYSGGGGGWMNRIYNVSLIPGKVYNVYVGYKGYSAVDNFSSSSITNYTTSGESSYFDTYASANGGSAGGNYRGGSGGSGGGGTFGGGRGYQFGGGAAMWNGNGRYAYDYANNGLLTGGDGGVWGGGGGGMFSNGGNGGYYGGGGGSSRLSNDWSSGYLNTSTGGNGGYYGGGGGSIVNMGLGGLYFDNGTWKQSGFGGNGGNMTIEGENGTNTIGYTNFKVHTNEGFDEVNYNLAGNGISGKCPNANNKGLSSGGGGYGGTGGNRASDPIAWHQTGSGCGGGGGYGSSGGDGMDTQYYSYYPGGGGGGYGGNGSSYGGGGGYMSTGYYGGGGYWHNSSGKGGGGAKISIPINNSYLIYIFGDGASPADTIDGVAGNGGVVLRYYKWVDPRNPT